MDDGGAEADKEPSALEIYPIYAEFNTYYLNFCVVTKQEVKIYDCSNGRLEKIHSNFADFLKK
jgi:hypothetical protein